MKIATGEVEEKLDAQEQPKAASGRRSLSPIGADVMR